MMSDRMCLEKTMYRFKGDYLPEELQESIDRYISDGVPPGGFLEAVINNDLKLAVGRADDINVKLIQVIIGYLYNEAPMGCWGFSGAFESWIEKKRQQRQLTAGTKG